ncbi:C2H2 type zinc finger domain protein [Ilyonectria robusta]
MTLTCWHSQDNKVLPHRCSICPKQFSRSDLAKKHELLHQKRSKNTSPAESSTVSPSLTSDGLNYGQVHPADSISPGPPPIDPSLHGVFNAPSHREYRRSNVDMLLNEDPGIGMDTALDHSQFPNSHVDFSSFARPWDESGQTPQDWFTVDFFEALHETNGGSRESGGFQSQPDEFPFMPTFHPLLSFEDAVGAPALDATERHSEQAEDAQYQEPPGRISRVPSPPNVPSSEDCWPFAWNPSSTAISHGKPIYVDDHDPLLVNHDSRFDINEATWTRLRRFLEPLTPVQSDVFTLPSLRVVNAFIALFFKFFSAQSPVLHGPTLDMNSLPPPLVAIIMVIGAKYSHLRHTRRFAILVQDRARCNLQTAIDNDRRLLRDLNVIYAYALICYTGLWCGNKGAFEIAEALRGTLVTYIRRLPKVQDAMAQVPNLSKDPKSQWMYWIAAESRRRLMWFVFTLDGQFPALLNMKSMMSLAEVARWKCPCDDEFWTAPTARIWKNLLGLASLPPAPTFAMVSGPFLYQASQGSKPQGIQMTASAMRLNQWTAFLVLMALSTRALDWAHDWGLAVIIILETTDEDSLSETIAGNKYGHQIHDLVERRQGIISSLETWAQACAQPGFPPPRQGGTGLYFQEASSLLYGLTRMSLNVSITDLQEAIGKDGPDGIKPAINRLKVWSLDGYFASASWSSAVQDTKSQAFMGAVEAINTIASIANRPSAQAAVPYSLIGLFLAHVLLWGFAMTTSPESKQLLRQHVSQLSLTGPIAEQLSSVLESSLSANPTPGFDAPCSIFKHAAYSLTRLGTWGASLNMALLLHKRSEL